MGKKSVRRPTRPAQNPECVAPRESCEEILLQAALRLADHGYPVCPCAPRSKKPITTNGFHDATTDHEQIQQWWNHKPDANVAIRTNGLLVLDIDGANNPWLADDPDRLEELAAAPTSLTPRGGRHHFFRQPTGRSWRCTAGRLAPNVDTRAIGGYVVVPPSLVNGIEYIWLEGRELSMPSKDLPEPPHWLVIELDALTKRTEVHTQIMSLGGLAFAASERDLIPEGQRNDALTRFAGTMRHAGMTQAEIAAALSQVNADRCVPRLDASEVDGIAASVARYSPGNNSKTANQQSMIWRQGDAPPIELMNVGALIARHQSLRAPLIHGLLRRGETMNVIAPAKLGKSWLVLAMVLCVATGRRWLDTFQTVAGKVLIVDNELHPETLAHRIPLVAEHLGIDVSDVKEAVSVLSLRGRLRDICALGAYLASLEPGQFTLIVLDAFYRFLPQGIDENDNGAIANIYNYIDYLADRLSCSFVLIHHASKGNQSFKTITDVGAGAGSQSRATDTHLVLRPHEEAGVVVLEAAVRSSAPVRPVALRWTFPLWSPASDVDPTRLQAERPRRRKGEPKPTKPVLPDWTVEQFFSAFISDQPASKAKLRENAKDVPGLSGRRVENLIQIGESQGLIHRWVEGRSHKVLYASGPQPKAPEAGA